MRLSKSAIVPPLWLLVLSTAILLFFGGQVSFAADACITCHKDFTPDLMDAFREDVHAANQQACVGCHGGNPNAADDDMAVAHETTDFTPPPWTASESVERCGSCHKKAVQELGTGPHRGVIGEHPDPDLPGCTRCHASHPIYKIQDAKSPVNRTAVLQTCSACHADPEMMARHNLSPQIPNEYRNSVHGRELLTRDNVAAPSCIGCHDNHSGHNENVSSFDEACSLCHQREAKAFKTSKHQRVWELTNTPVCITCHGSHAIEIPSVEMLGTGPGTICSKCHNPGDSPDVFRSLLAKIEKEFSQGQALIVEAEKSGKNVDAQIKILEQVRTQLQKARQSIHYFDLDRFRREVDKGLELSSNISTSVEQLFGESSCITCHRKLDPEMVAGFSNDVHADKKISCDGCHGGNPLLQDEKAMSKEAGFVGVPKRPADIGPFCARCHSKPETMNAFVPGIATDQLSQYALSGHGQALSRNPFDKNVATCASCHGVHSIRTIDDPLSPVYAVNVPGTCNTCHGNRALMNSYGIQTNPYEDYRGSVHGKALLEQGDVSAPACNDCHGNHGAMPPEVDNIANVCGQCHLINANLFKLSIHRGIFELRGMEQCSSCHGHHAINPPTDAMLSTMPGSFCAKCHDPGSAPDQVREMFTNLDAKSLGARNKLRLAESYLVNVDDGFFKLDKAKSEITKMRVLVHLFDLDTLKVADKNTLATLQGVEDIGDKGIENAMFRRKGFLLALGLFALFLAIVILKIRELDKQRKLESQ
ncbi:MAG: cytochrome c3 family protein [bacterium]